MKLLITAMVFVLTSNFLSAHKSFVYIVAVSDEITTVTGSVSLTIKYKAEEDISFSASIVENLPAGWTANASQIVGTNLSAQQSVNKSISISYPANALPYYPVQLSLKTTVVDNSSNETQIKETRFWVYFTPWSTVELWSAKDFATLKRDWHHGDEATAPPRLSFPKSTVPVSDIDESTTLPWSQSTWESMEEFTEYLPVSVPGLAYDVLMRAPSQAERDSLREIGDGIDSADATRATFTGTITGRLVSEITNDFGQVIQIPLSGMRVRFYDDDLVFDDFIGATYTNANGEFTLTYSISQINEGSFLELYVKVKSKTSPVFQIKSSHMPLCDVYALSLDEDFGGILNAVKTAADADFGDVVIEKDMAPVKYEAFNAVHWCNVGYTYFLSQGVPLFPGLDIDVNFWGLIGSVYLPSTACGPTVRLEEGDAETENVVYHEFGHHTMHSLQGGFVFPCYEGFGHSWGAENTAHAAWIEGWANIVQFILDATQWQEDGEYGYDGEASLTSIWGKPIFERPWDPWLNNGMRSEFHFACAVYDLWDGADKGLPETFPWRPGASGTMSGYNDTGTMFPISSSTLYRSKDDVSLSFFQICQPLLENPGTASITDPEKYYHELLDNMPSQVMRSNVSRIFRENKMIWNINDYDAGRRPSGYTSDVLYEGTTFSENPDVCPNYVDIYQLSHAWITGTTKHLSGTNVNLTDEIWIGDNDAGGTGTYNLALNYGGPVSNGTFTVWGLNLVDVRDGNLIVGGLGKTAHLVLDEKAMLRIRQDGKLIINSGSTVRIKEGASLWAHNGAHIQIHGTGKLIAETGAYVCLHTGTDINLIDPTSVMELQPGVLNGKPSGDYYHGNKPFASDCAPSEEWNVAGLGTLTFDCLDFADYYDQENPIEITSNTLYSTDWNIRHTLKIKPGAKLTVTSTMYMHPDVRILIEPGGELVLDGGTLTGICESMWRGIEVWGNAFMTQVPLGVNQGLLNIKNGATIEYAVNAIRLIKEGDNPGDPADWSKTGGVVMATNSTFRNNWRSFEFMRYPHPSSGLPPQDNLSHIINCEFITDGYLRAPYSIPYGAITIYGTDGVVIKGSDFTYANASHPPNSTIGIYSIDASYKVDMRCTSLYPFGTPCPVSEQDKNTFNNLYTGVATSGNVGSANVSIRRSVFNNCTYGARLLGAYYNDVIQNTFNIPIGDLTYPYNPTYFGVYMDMSDGAMIEDNDFTFSGTLGMGLGNNIGVSASNSINSGVDIYRNTFTEMVTGVQVKNSNPLLQIDCNQLYRGSETMSDIHLASGSIALQGSCIIGDPDPKKPAGNQFYGACGVTGDDWQMYANPGTFLGYRAYDTDVPTHPQFSCINGGVSLFDCNNVNFALPIFTTANSCPVITQIDGLIAAQMEVAKMEYSESIGEINGLVGLYDAGSTSQLISVINSGTDIQVYNALHQASPYLTDRVLKEYILSIPPQNYLMEIIVENSPVSQEVYGTLGQIEMDPDVMDVIDNAQTDDPSPRDELDANVAFVNNVKLLALNTLTRNLLDTNMIDSALYYLDRDESLEASLMLVPLAMEQSPNLVAEHIDLIRTASAEIELDGDIEEAKRLNRFCDFYELLTTINSRPEGYYGMTVAERINLQDWASLGTDIGINAQAILDFTNETLPYIPGEPYLEYKADWQTNFGGSNKKGSVMQNVPNPFVNGTTLSGKINRPFSSARIEIRDPAGRLIKSVNIESGEFSVWVDMYGFRSGIYMYTLTIDDAHIETKRMVKL